MHVDVKLTMEEIEIRLEQIRRASGDYELAHILEDRLRDDVLSAISSGGIDGADVRLAASAVLTSADVEFPRYCA